MAKIDRYQVRYSIRWPSGLVESENQVLHARQGKGLSEADAKKMAEEGRGGKVLRFFECTKLPQV